MVIARIISGITNKLDESFDSDIPKYVDFLPQNFQRPCFFVSMVNEGIERQVFDQWFIEPQFNVQYFEDEGIRSYAVRSLDIQLALQMIELDNGDKVLGRNLNSVLTPDSLHNFVNYNAVIYETKDRTKMDTMSLDTKVREVR